MIYHLRKSQGERLVGYTLVVDVMGNVVAAFACEEDACKWIEMKEAEEGV